MSDSIFDKLLTRDVIDSLRSYTIKSKMRRLRLPTPGTLVKVRTFVSLTPLSVDKSESRVQFQYRDALLMVMFVDTLPPIQGTQGQWGYLQQNITDPVDIVFMTQTGVLASTGPRAGADVMAPYEVLCC